MAERTVRIASGSLACRILQEAAKGWPEGTKVRHGGSGREGTVRMDNPDHVPGWILGDKPTAWCLTGEHQGSVLVCVRWENEFEIPWVAWTLGSSLTRPGAAPRVVKER